MFSPVSSLHTSKQTWYKNESSVCVLLLIASICGMPLAFGLLNASSHMAVKDVNVSFCVHRNFELFFNYFCNNPN